MKKKTRVILLILTILVSSCNTVKVYDLRCEGLQEPLAIDNNLPHFSWKILSPKRQNQTFYEIEVGSNASDLRSGKTDLWKSGKIESEEQIRTYGGEPLHAREEYWWRIRVGSGNRMSKWSEPQRFGIGLLGEMRGNYIGAAEGESSLLRRQFTIEKHNQRAILYVNSLGYHEVWLNGERVGNDVLNPAVSQLDRHSLIKAYDISEQLREGENEWVIWTSAGWYRQHFGAEYNGGVVRAELDLDGVPIVVTDTSWKGCKSGYSDIGSWIHDDYTGERIDARLVPQNLTQEALDRLEWSTIDTVSVTATAVEQMCEPCRIQESFSAVNVTPYGKDMWLADMGKVVNGLPEMRLPPLPAGHETTVGFTDNLPDDGTVFTFLHNTLISSGNKEGDLFQGRFIQQAFRYLVLVNLPEAPQPEDIRVHRMRTDYGRRATFSCSDSELCAIHDLVAYTTENLAFNGYMVDCGSLEKHGYGGDGNASTQTLQTLFEAAPLYYNWMQAWRDVVRDDGSLPYTAPSTHATGGGPYWSSFLILAPWRTFMNYGDDRTLVKGYDAMQRWIQYAETTVADGLYFKKGGTERYGLGDWLAPQGVDVKDTVSVSLVNNCTMSQCLHYLSLIASHLGRHEDSLYYARQRDLLNEKIHQHFYCGAGIYGTGTQTDMAYPLIVGAIPDSLVPLVESTLISRTQEVYNGHIACGLAGVPVLTEWATQAGEGDFIYNLLKKKDYPGYLYMLEQGATGVWESWDGQRSRLHNCYNGIGSWFYQGLGGIIATAPAYRHVRINPQTPKEITWCEVSEETPYGPLWVRWETRGKGHLLKVNIPSGITAEIFGKQYMHGNYRIKVTSKNSTYEQ